MQVTKILCVKSAVKQHRFLSFFSVWWKEAEGFAFSIYHTQVGMGVAFLTQELFLKIVLYLFKLAACLSFHF